MNARTDEPAQSSLLIVEESRSRRPELAPDPAAHPLMPVGANANALLAAITAAASNPSIDVGKVERLWAMHQTVVKQQAEAAFNDAMARTQAEIEPVINNATNTHTKSTYAKLAAIDKAITPIHTKHGLSVSYDTETKNVEDPIEQGMLRIVAIVSHSGGHSRKHHIDLPLDIAGAQGTTNKTKVQATGSTNAYGRRYLKLMIFNVSTMDDNDGNGAEGKNKDKSHANDRGEDEASGLPFYPGDRFVKSMPEWKRLIGVGDKTVDQIITTVGSRYRFSVDQLKKLRAAEGAKQ